MFVFISVMQLQCGKTPHTIEDNKLNLTGVKVQKGYQRDAGSQSAPGGFTEILTSQFPKPASRRL